jgi:structural maintenance of chromosome 3 (chondroitin sulfate proteoglycan 6)
MRRKEEECTRELSLKEQKRKELYAKQGRGSQFTSKAQRDEWIQKELKSLNKQIKDKTEQIDKLSDDLKKDSKKKVELEKKIDELTGHSFFKFYCRLLGTDHRYLMSRLSLQVVYL